jgi:hypothetical protein
MKVETYEIEEINSSEASTMAADAEALELIEKLGLEGQKSLTNPNTATRFPYPRMTQVQAVVFGACFPRVVKLEEFSREIIPLRVLQVAAFCKEWPQSAHLEVWHTGVAKKDPVLVGADSRYSSEKFLLARWGDALPTFEELQENAKSILRAQYALKISKLEQATTTMRHSLDDLVENAVQNGETPHFGIYA